MIRARLIAGIVLVGILVALAVLGPRACTAAKRALAGQEAATARAEGQVQAATDATGITAGAMTQAATIEDQTRENDRAIRSAPGADTPVPAGSNSAALRAICLRASYRNQPRCIALLGPGAGAAR